MSRICALLVVFMALFIAVTVALAQRRPVNRNPFDDYAEWMPGQVMPKEADTCAMYARPYPGGLYVACHFDEGAFSTISLAGDYAQITGVYFFPRSMAAGDLLLWLGEPEQTRRMGKSWIFNWATVRAYTRRGVNRYEARVQMVWFTKGNQ